MLDTVKKSVSRMLAFLLCVCMLLGILPTAALADTVDISDVSAPDPAEYIVDAGTERSSVGLPTELEITMKNESSTRMEPVEWVGEYDKDTVGEYTLKAAFTNKALSFSAMPTVRIIVAEPGTSEEIKLLDALQDTNGDEESLTESDDVNYSAVCRLTPKKSSYASGESIQFTLSAQYATPGGAGKSPSVTFGIPIPDTSPAVQLPMFYKTGTGEYDGVPMYPISYNGTTINLYLVTDSDGDRWIEFTVDAGSTIRGTLSMKLPNGVSNAISAFTLTPEIRSKGDYGTNTLLKGGTTKVTAEFGWNNVNKSASIDNVGVIGKEKKDYDRITYSVTADSLSSGLATGRIFTEHYVLTDTISLSGLHYADGELTLSEANGISTASIDGKPVLEIAAPQSTLKVTKQSTGGQVTAFITEYTVSNTTLKDSDVTAAELPNLNLSVSLLLSEMRLNPGNEATRITNTARFEAYPLFGDAHVSTASHTAYTQDRYVLTKAAYEDEECTRLVDIVQDGDSVFYKITATNYSSGDGPFKITDVLPNGLTYIGSDPVPASQSGQTVTWDGLTIPSGDSVTIVLKTEFCVDDFTELLELHNVAKLYDADRLLISASADCIFLTGEDNEADVSYEKTVDKSSAQLGESLSYTITVKNKDRSVPKLITVVDKWPGEGIIPTAVAGCSKYELLDAGDVTYKIEDVAKDPTINIAKIKCYNVYVPAGGSTKITIQGTMKAVSDELVNIVGEGTSGAAYAKTYGVSLSKAAYAYDADTQSHGSKKLSASTPVSAGSIVCYEMKIANYKTAKIDKLQLIDKLPAGLSLRSVSFHGISSSVVLRRGDAYFPLTVTGDPSTNEQTTDIFPVDAGETVYVYLFAEVSKDAIDASVNTAQRIVNAAYVKFNKVQTGDATANIFTDFDTEKKLYMDKWIRFVADYDDELHYQGTWLQTPEGEDVQVNGSASTATVWNGAYIGYQLQIKNATSVGTEPINIYEIIDNLPSGTEFIGVAKNGDRHNYFSTSGKRDLTGELIRAGQTAAWKGGVHSSHVKCTYDTSVNQVRIQFVDANNAPAPVSVVPSSDNSQKLFILIVVRVKADSTASSYVNIAEVKVDKDVVVLDDSAHNEVRFDEASNMHYISASCTTNTVPMKPGISKQFIGHYFPSDAKVPENVEASADIRPGESLRFTVQVKNEGLDDNINAANASLTDFTVTDILPAEYAYRENSAMVELNAGYNTATGLQTTEDASAIARGSFEPTQELLSDGSTKLTWTFSGKDMRLLCNTLNSKAGFMHILTYDTDWKSENLSLYGNYTNTASVNHSYRFASVSTGTPDADGRSITATAIVSVFGAEGTTAVKAVTNAAGEKASGSDTVPYVSIAAGEKVDYTLNVTNSTAISQNRKAASLVIIDELPRADGDTGVVNRVDRGSQFSVLFGADPEVYVAKVTNGSETKVDPSEYTVSYGNSAGGLNSNGDWTNSENGGNIAWGTASDGMNAVRIAFDPEYALASDETILVRFSAFASIDAKPDEIAWNSFGYSYMLLSGGERSEKIYAEPPRVGISVPSTTISVNKVVVGDGAPAATLFTFLLKQDGAPLADVKYTLSGDTAVYRTGPDGSFTLTEAQTATLLVAPGSGYTVEETNVPKNFTSKGIASAAFGDGTYADPVFSFKTLAAGEKAGAICKNDYVVPPMRGPVILSSITTEPVKVKKLIEGDSKSQLSSEKFLFSLNAVSCVAPGGQTTLMEPSAMPMPNQNSNGEMTVEVTGEHSNDFGEITFTLAGTYVYTITEVKGKNTLCDYDESIYTLTYTVEDDGSGKLTCKEVIEKDGKAVDPPDGAVVFTNTYIPPVGTLTVSKTVTNGGAVNAQFAFLFTFGEQYSEKARYNYVMSDEAKTKGTIASGERLALKHSESVTITIPQGVSYEVVENAYLNYRPKIENTNKGVIGSTESTVAYTNSYDPSYVPPTSALTGNLTVQKKVTGDLADTQKDFAFTIVLSTSDSYSFTGSKTGTIKSGDTILLKHDEYITIVNLPAGTKYSVTESGNSGYRVYASGDAGVIAANGASVAAFTNSRSKVPPTGEDGALFTGVMLMLISLVGGSVLLVALRRLKHGHRSTRASR